MQPHVGVGCVGVGAAGLHVSAGGLVVMVVVVGGLVVGVPDVPGSNSG